MGSLSIWHWLVVLLIVLLIFGTKKLRNIGTDLGNAVKGFKDGMRGNAEQDKNEQQIQSATTGKTIEGEVQDKTQTKA